MIQCVLEYRTSTPLGWLAFQFLNYDFNSNNFYDSVQEKRALTNLLNQADNVRKTKKQEYREEIEKIQSLIKELENDKVFFFFLRKSTKFQLEEAYAKLKALEEELSTTGYKEELNICHKFLRDNKYCLVDKKYLGGDCGYYWEKWEKK